MENARFQEIQRFLQSFSISTNYTPPLFDLLQPLLAAARRLKFGWGDCLDIASLSFLEIDDMPNVSEVLVVPLLSERMREMLTRYVNSHRPSRCGTVGSRHAPTCQQQG